MSMLRRIEKGIEILTFFLIFWLSILPLYEWDIWYHLKIGGLIAQKGLFFTEPFSFTASGRPLVPFEWLFQVGMYTVSRLGGLEAIPYIVATGAVILSILLYCICRATFHLPKLLALLLVIIFYTANIDMVTARPFVFTYILLVATLLLIFLFVLRQKNYLWLTVPLTIVLANFHSSVVFIPYFFFSFGIAHFLSQNPDYPKRKKEAGILFLFGILTGIASILPPLGFSQYQQLLLTANHLNTLSPFLIDWNPASIATDRFLFFLTGLITALCCFFFALGKLKEKRQVLILLPFIPLLVFAFLAVRNLFFGNLAAFCILVWSLSHIGLKPATSFGKIVVTAAAVSILGFCFVYIQQKHIVIQTTIFPFNAVRFLQTHHMQGNMYHDYEYGGYFIYHLYPEYKVFIYGWTDPFVCCEIPSLDTFQKSILSLPDAPMRQEVQAFFKTYDISFVVLTKSFPLNQRLVSLLANDPAWSLVFWDDVSAILVKKDRKNDHILASWGTKAANPFSKSLYRNDNMDTAIKEYEHMIQFTDSALSRNALGELYLRRGDIPKARASFTRALEIMPTYSQAYMNLQKTYFTQ